jgi:hypothetical protein
MVEFLDYYLLTVKGKSKMAITIFTGAYGALHNSMLTRQGEHMFYYYQEHMIISKQGNISLNLPSNTKMAGY